MALTNALYKFSRQKQFYSTDGNEGDGTCEVHNTEGMQIAVTDVNSSEGEHSESSARREEDQTESASDEEDGGSSGEDALDAAIMRNVFGDEHINDSSEELY